MEEKILLHEFSGEYSDNVVSHVDIGLTTKSSLMPLENISKTFSLLEQYNAERDECNRFRVILSINPVCSNVLYNKKTEILLNEGSPECVNILDTKTSISKDELAPNALNSNDISYLQMIRDTEYSHVDNGGFTYHCGIDIFNNHFLRKKEFVNVNKYNDYSKEKSQNVFNTISDYSRDGRGNIIKDSFSAKRNDTIDSHLYQYDTIMSMQEAFLDNCYEKNGWWGFTNPCTISMNDDALKGANTLLSYKKPCEFVDLYPDRSLFSFIPKYNKHRKRLENNWDYCLTYPFAKDEEKINEICGGREQAIRANAVERVNASSLNILECSSYFKHNLKAGDYVTFFYYRVKNDTELLNNIDSLVSVEDKGVFYFYKNADFDIEGNLLDEATPITTITKDGLMFTRYEKRIQVLSVGDTNGQYLDRVFNVRLTDVNSILGQIKSFGCFYKKNSSSTDCVYYFRKFKKLKAIDGNDIRSEINKVGFGQNIYGDDIAQIIFTDDVDVSGLKDHNGRDVSEIFLTVVKRNKGYQQWYCTNPDFSDENIEYSHCFGEVTSGIDFYGIEKEPFDYNVRYLHNIKSPSLTANTIENTLKAWGDTITKGCPLTLESNISIENDEFYGDIVEFDTSEYRETVIGSVYHRFNTAQREFFGMPYRDVRHDVITKDDYDDDGAGNFKVETYFFNDSKTSVGSEDTGHLIYANISPEGYFYQPHTKIKIREEDAIATLSAAKYINYATVVFDKIENYLLIKPDGTVKLYNNKLSAIFEKEDGDEIKYQNSYIEITITAPIDYGFIKGDYICFYDKTNQKSLWGEIIRVKDNDVTVRYDVSVFDYLDEVGFANFNPVDGKRHFYAFWSPNNVPFHAQLCEGRQKFIWRNIISPSKLTRADELYDTPFTNGCFYVERNITMFLRRQDPIGKYGLSNPLIKGGEVISNPMLTFNITGHTPIDLTPIIHNINNALTTCF